MHYPWWHVPYATAPGPGQGQGARNGAGRVVGARWTLGGRSGPLAIGEEAVTTGRLIDLR